MKRIFRKRRGKRLTVLAALGFTAMITSTVTANEAAADGYYSWRNEYVGQYMEVWHSDTANGGIVIVWPFNANSWNQVWYDTKLSDGYYRLTNANSGRVLDRWENAGNGNWMCDVTQWSWWNGAQQHWRYQSYYSPIYERSFSWWINKAGCRGNAWNASLGVRNPFNNSNVNLYNTDYCTEGSWIGKPECHWNRLTRN